MSTSRLGALTRALAVAGTVLVTLPLVLPLLTSLRFIGRPGGLRVDYLMPFEVYPVTLIGMALVLWASLRAKLRRRNIGIAEALMIGGVVLGAVAATATGIADSVETLEAWRYIVTAGFGVASLLAQVWLIVEGVLLTREIRENSGYAPPLTPTAHA